MTHIWCFVRKPLDKRRQHLSALVANFCKEGHTHLELSRALALQYDEGNGVSVQELSEMLNLSPCLIYQSIALQKLLPELQNLLDPPVPRKERLRFECARILAKAPPEKQMEYYREAKKEATPVLMKLRLRELCAEWLVKRGRKRQPSDYVPILRRIVSTTASDARLISDQSGTESVKLLSAGLKPEERAGFVRSLQAGISALQGLVNELAPKTEK